MKGYCVTGFSDSSSQEEMEMTAHKLQGSQVLFRFPLHMEAVP